MPYVEEERYRIYEIISPTGNWYILVDMVNGDEHQKNTLEEIADKLKELTQG